MISLITGAATARASRLAKQTIPMEAQPGRERSGGNVFKTRRRRLVREDQCYEHVTSGRKERDEGAVTREGPADCGYEGVDNEA